MTTSMRFPCGHDNTLIRSLTQVSETNADVMTSKKALKQIIPNVELAINFRPWGGATSTLATNEFGIGMSFFTSL